MLQNLVKAWIDSSRKGLISKSRAVFVDDPEYKRYNQSLLLDPIKHLTSSLWWG